MCSCNQFSNTRKNSSRMRTARLWPPLDVIKGSRLYLPPPPYAYHPPTPRIPPHLCDRHTPVKTIPSGISVVLVCLFTGEGAGVTCDHYPWGIGPHYTGPPSSLTCHLSVHGHARSQPCPCPVSALPLLVTSYGYHWRPLPHCCWHLMTAIEALSWHWQWIHTSIFWHSVWIWIHSLKFLPPATVAGR